MTPTRSRQPAVYTVWMIGAPRQDEGQPRSLERIQLDLHLRDAGELHFDIPATLVEVAAALPDVRRKLVHELPEAKIFPPVGKLIRTWPLAAVPFR